MGRVAELRFVSSSPTKPFLGVFCILGKHIVETSPAIVTDLESEPAPDAENRVWREFVIVEDQTVLIDDLQDLFEHPPNRPGAKLMKSRVEDVARRARRTGRGWDPRATPPDNLMGCATLDTTTGSGSRIKMRHGTDGQNVRTARRHAMPQNPVFITTRLGGMPKQQAKAVIRSRRHSTPDCDQ